MDDILKQKPPGEAKCPGDGEALKREEVFRDRLTQREILALECYCPNKSLGCLWTGLLAYLQDHGYECPYTKVKCPYCQVGYPGVKMREHFVACVQTITKL